ncbi:MAG: NUDIX hydrolase [Candidatus Nanoarchaeia archaeon]|jgi:8-oxo-dGTP diphosphatase|nr:NUDIX hydrolase [Candidatus Nanoarchaeia archaeon]
MIEFKNAASTASLIVCKENCVYLIKRKHDPFKGQWALPGGFLNCDQESLEEAAVRELFEETKLKAKIESLKLVMVNSNPKRDPRGHVIDHVFIVVDFDGEPEAADDASEIKKFNIDALPELAFDHKEVLSRLIKPYKNLSLYF